MFTIVIHYPSDLDGLTRWSKTLFAVFYTCGLLGTTSFVAAVGLWLTDRPLWLAAAVGGFGFMLGWAMNGLQPLMSEVERRRWKLIAPDIDTDVEA